MTSCIDIQVERVGELLNPSCSFSGGAIIRAERIGEKVQLLASCPAGVRVNTTVIGNPMKLTCSLVCSTSSEYYLDVLQESIWLTLDNGFSEDIEVRANVKWRIE